MFKKLLHGKRKSALLNLTWSGLLCRVVWSVSQLLYLLQRAGHFKFFSPSFFVGLELTVRRKDFKKEHYMRTELIRIPTPSHPLDSAYYTPEGPIKGAVMYCHGNQMNFYVCAARFLAPYITSLGYVFLAFNRRGHDSVSTFDSREPVGGAYQTVAEGIEDNELAAQFLAGHGFRNPVVIGHS